MSKKDRAGAYHSMQAAVGAADPEKLREAANLLTDRDLSKLLTEADGDDMASRLLRTEAANRLDPEGRGAGEKNRRALHDIHEITSLHQRKGARNVLEDLLKELDRDGMPYKILRRLGQTLSHRI